MKLTEVRSVSFWGQTVKVPFSGKKKSKFCWFLIPLLNRVFFRTLMSYSLLQKACTKEVLCSLSTTVQLFNYAGLFDYFIWCFEEPSKWNCFFFWGLELQEDLFTEGQITFPLYLNFPRGVLFPLFVFELFPYFEPSSFSSWEPRARVSCQCPRKQPKAGWNVMLLDV